MAANFVKKSGASYDFGTYADATTPIAAEFDFPVKRIRVPMDTSILGGSSLLSASVITWIPACDSMSFPSVAGYPKRIMFGGGAGDPCKVDVEEFGDVANEHYFDILAGSH